MKEDELIREIQLKKQLSELDGSLVPEYDPSESMSEEELRSDNRFLIERLRESQEEIRQLRQNLSDITHELKESNRRADEEASGRKRLFDKLEKFMDEQKSDSEKYRELERKYETLQGRYDLLCAAHYGGSKTCSDKYSSQKNEGINDGRDDFDGGEKQIS